MDESVVRPDDRAATPAVRAEDSLTALEARVRQLQGRIDDAIIDLDFVEASTHEMLNLLLPGGLACRRLSARLDVDDADVASIDRSIEAASGLMAAIQRMASGQSRRDERIEVGRLIEEAAELLRAPAPERLPRDLVGVGCRATLRHALLYAAKGASAASFQIERSTWNLLRQHALGWVASDRLRPTDPVIGLMHPTPAVPNQPGALLAGRLLAASGGALGVGQGVATPEIWLVIPEA